MKKYFIPVICAASLLTTFSGCKTLEAPSSYQETWHPPAIKKLNVEADNTWSTIRSQKVDSANPITLLELINIALINNPTTRQTWENARTTWAKKVQAQADYYPTITGTGEILQSKSTANNKSTASNWNYVDYTPSVMLEYLLFDMGGREARVKSATYNLLAANYTFNRSIQDLVLSVGEAYYALYSAQALIVASKYDVNNTKTTLLSAQKKFSAGLVSKLDVLKAESDYYNSVYNLENAKGLQKTAKADLAKTLGLSADTPFTIVVPSKRIPTMFDKEDISALITDALGARPDIRAERARLRSKEAAIKAAESGLLPKFTFSTSINKDSFGLFNSDKAWADDYLYNAYDFKATWDIFDGFANNAKVWQARSEANAERDALETAEIQLSRDVWAKFYTLKANIKKNKSSKAYLDAAKGSYDLALEGYQAGLKSILDITQAQRDLSDARNKMIASSKDLFFSLLELVHAMGALYPETIRPYLER